MSKTHHAIGLLGGTFDPIHIGHLRLALEAQMALQLKQVHLIPCLQPVHRTPPIASPEARFAMIQAAVQREPILFADDREIRRQTPSYTIDTLLEIRTEKPQTPLCLLMGLDAFLNFHTWHRFEDIFALAHLVIAHRPAFQPPAEGVTARLIQEHLCTDVTLAHQQLGGLLFLLPLTPLEISASTLRTQLSSHQNVRYLIPDEVYHYIQEKHLYSGL